MSIFETLANYRVVPVISIEDANDALALADVLIDAGLPVAEITLRTDAAISAIEQIAKHRPAMLVGAGTVLDEDQLGAVQAAGAAFALSPGLDVATVAVAQTIGIPFAPGIMTPSDIQIALRAGCRMVKFFPATAAGGLPMLKSLADPFRHTGLTFNPTGGITQETTTDWLGYGPVKAVGGSWIARPEDLSSGNWDAIYDRAKAARALAGTSTRSEHEALV
ncbi:bifunctional 4-hydroxy-2-oxoglutarate aldolase/2-dehydro-3-deoxy-phosphogluconate aldolase [Shimia sp. MIT910701]|jgi:2-dehydro-3-deoxyphosphogluconate aldolase/(4S)-4-hydroxy-2-oxoglutarate aldolase|uniref:bifunctional 4-hydroxy-2-oxoglutarate aldolase/2-dehydro-3-deoxy-phosphogluconate aldolase n=1 Tax=Shimia sp. MIT910701 TaxID=3096987 RepID=UPI00399AF23D